MYTEYNLSRGGGLAYLYPWPPKHSLGPKNHHKTILLIKPPFVYASGGDAYFKLQKISLLGQFLYKILYSVNCTHCTPEKVLKFFKVSHKREKKSKAEDNIILLYHLDPALAFSWE